MSKMSKVIDLRSPRPRPRPRPAATAIAGDIRRRTPVAAARSVAARPAAVPPAPVDAPTPRPLATKPARQIPGWLNVVQYPLFAIGGLAAAFNSTAGQIIVGCFGLYVLLFRRPARWSFGAALFVLLTVPLFQALGRDGVAGNAAIYVYELLVIGTISAIIELRKSGDITE